MAYDLTCFRIFLLCCFLFLFFTGSFKAIFLYTQITGNIVAVKKALLSVSGCLQDKPRLDAANSGSGKFSGRLLHGTCTPATV